MSEYKNSQQPNDLNEEDQRLLRLWQMTMCLQDPRANNKGLALLLRASMNDESLRAALVNNPETVLAKFRAKYGLPDGLTLRFFENVSDTLNVVLPPRAGEIGKRPSRLRDVLVSATDSPKVPAFFSDDFDLGNVFDPQDGTDHGDASRDPPIVQ